MKRGKQAIEWPAYPVCDDGICPDPDLVADADGSIVVVAVIGV